MMRGWGSHTVEAIDYELIWIGHDPEHVELGDFRDAHAVSEPVWRLVSGYLMLSGDDGAETGTDDAARAVDDARLVVSSHGHPIAALHAEPTRAVIDSEGPWRIDGTIARGAGGVAVVADPHTVLGLSTDARTLSVSSTDDASRPAWGMTVVHGPAAAKIENRIRLLRSLHRVGGRHV